MYKQKLFYHIQAKGGAMIGNLILFAQSLLSHILLQLTFKLLIAACLYAYCVNELCSASCSALCCWWTYKVAIVLLQLLAQSGRAVAWKVQLAASSDVPRSMTRLKDIILIYLFLTSFLPVHYMHCPTPCSHITYSYCCDRGPCVFHVCTSTVQCHIKYTYMNKSFGNKSICNGTHLSNFANY